MKGELRVCGTQMSGCEVWGYIWVCVAECFGCVWMIGVNGYVSFAFESVWVVRLGV